MQKFEFAILGAGAMGSILGAHLVRAGHSVAMLARGRRAQQVRHEGLRVTGLARFAVPIHVIDEPVRLREAHVLVVATKAIGTAESLKPLADAKIGRGFSIQNGVLKNDARARRSNGRANGAVAAAGRCRLPNRGRDRPDVAGNVADRKRERRVQGLARHARVGDSLAPRLDP